MNMTEWTTVTIKKDVARMIDEIREKLRERLGFRPSRSMTVTYLVKTFLEANSGAGTSTICCERSPK